MKKLILIFVLALLPIVSFAAINVQKTTGSAALTTSKNIYTAGNIINISQERAGSVFAAGNLVSITANIGKDLFAGASNVNISSKISGDVKAVGGTINISGDINGEAMLAGGQILIAQSSVIDGDFLSAGGGIDIAGTINGNAKIGGGEITISGTLNKDADIRAKNLTIESTAIINGNINYHGEKEAVIKDGAKVRSKISFTKVEIKNIKTAGGFGAIFGIFWLIRLLAMIVATFILFFVFKKNIPKIAAETIDSFWKKLLKGFVVLVVVPIAIILSFITIIGIPLGLFGIAFYGLFTVVAVAFSGIVAAELLNRLFFRKEKARPLNWLMVILGVIVMQLIVFIPFVGWVAHFLIFLVSFGAVSGLLYRQVKTIAE